MTSSEPAEDDGEVAQDEELGHGCLTYAPTDTLWAVSDWLQQRPRSEPRRADASGFVSVLAIVGTVAPPENRPRRRLPTNHRPYTRYRWRKATTYVFIVVGVLLVGRQVAGGIQGARDVFLGLVRRASRSRSRTR